MVQSYDKNVIWRGTLRQLISWRARKSWTADSLAPEKELKSWFIQLEKYGAMLWKSGHKQRSYSNIVLLIYLFFPDVSSPPKRQTGRCVTPYFMWQFPRRPIPHFPSSFSLEFLFQKFAMSFVEWLYTNEEVLPQLLICASSHNILKQWWNNIKIRPQTKKLW